LGRYSIQWWIGTTASRNSAARSEEYSSTPAILADGQQVELSTYTCYLDWFGKEYRTQIVANDGASPLLGTMLLDGHDLAVSYKRRTVTLD
jgi:predicted aspartyl protease